MAKTRKKSSKKAAARRNSRSAFRTDQETFWAGDFGDQYTSRNTGPAWIASNAALFSKILSRAGAIRSAIEFGANLGLNLRALRLLGPDLEIAAVEINAKAAAQLRKIQRVKVHHQSILDFKSSERFDFAFVKGVLIHINPAELAAVYDALYRSSARFICLAEYYNPTPVSIPYRGHADRLFKRDFAGEMLARFRDLRLVDYGFAYHGDPNFPQDDLTWFLLEKATGTK
jgi:spore coat polysaccharide biosynthesis protein SpsF